MKSRPQLHPVLVAPVRLSLLAVLTTVAEVDFASLREQLGVSDSVLSKHIAQLESHDLVSVRKGYSGKRPRTWVSLTKEGRLAFKSHRAALLEIIGE